MSIYQSSVKKPITTALIYVAIAIIGIFSLTKLSVDLFPDMGENTIMVFTTYPGASAADIENNISKPLENILNSVSDLKHITSNSKENYSIIFLEFEYGIDIDEATNDVRDKLDMVSSALPDDANAPFLFKFSAEDIPIIMLSVQSKESTNALYKILDDKVASPLSRIGGVGTVSISGAPQREVQVYCDPYKLEAYGLTIEGIASVIGFENRNLPLGTMDVGSETYSMRVEGEFKDAYQMNNIVVGSFNGKNIYLRDVAQVKDTVQERIQEVYNNGVRGAMIIIQKQTGANTVDIANKVFEKLPDIKKSLPSDVKIDIIADNSESINNTIDSLIETILIVLILVVVVVLIFLGRWRATFIVAIVIPVSLVASFIYLLVTGNSLNIISLSSLSIAIGMVVDDAIVVLENITTHIERGSKPKSAAIFATSEVSLSVIATTLVLLCVYVPLTMITGVAGIMFQQLGWIVSIVCTVSTIAALSLTPMLSSVMLKNNPSRGMIFGAIYRPIEKTLNALDRGYSHILRWCVRHKTVVITVLLAVFFASLSLMKVIPTEFFPTMDQARLSMKVKLPIGTRVEYSRAFAMDLTNRFKAEYPEITMCNFSVGQPDEDNTFGMLSENGSHIISFNLRLLKKTERERSISEISDALRKDLSEYSEIRTYTVSTGMGGMGGQSSVDVEIYGYDFDLTDKFSNDLRLRMEQVKGCSEVTISREEYTPEIQIDFDREKLAENGLNLTTAGTYVRNRFNGSLASYYREDGEEYNIRVRYAPEFRESIETIENILVYNSQGIGIRIKDLGNVVERLTPPTIVRKDRERMVKVSCIVAKDAVLSELVAATQEQLDQMDIPSEISYDIGGTWEEQQESFGDIITLMFLIVILVYIVMASQFESFTYPFVIMFSIPFAFTGVFVGLAITKTALGIMALIGAMMLIGIVVKNGIVLIDYTILCRERGMNVRDAVVAAGRSRLRPILMTTLTTVLGMVPMAMDKGEGAEMWNSLGMTVAWGLTFSTLVTLVLIPILYGAFAEFGERRKKRIAAKAAKLEIVEK
ncbi:MAG: efflux RND transporter permease subunit [Bacteroidales bacterium]|nr:efflux RND transporter permease subunit [Bacteroidales bacterium]